MEHVERVETSGQRFGNSIWKYKHVSGKVLGTKAFITAPVPPGWNRGGASGSASLSRTAPEMSAVTPGEAGPCPPHVHTMAVFPGMTVPGSTTACFHTWALSSQRSGSSPQYQSPLTSAWPEHHIILLVQGGQLAAVGGTGPGRGPCDPTEEKSLSKGLCQSR